jgi:ribosome-associated toxin RatA of RatAB toxin-antitoxin module
MPLTSSVPTGGPARVRRFVVAAAVAVLTVLSGSVAASGDPDLTPQVSVREERGTYTVTARFDIPQASAAALAVLSDYERIPQFMPEIKTSVVLSRTEGRILVEQEAISRFMMFSKKVHLLLEVTQDDSSLRFVDRCGKSFTTYQGAWRATPAGGRTTVTYELTAKPAFDVPEFILKRLLKRDSVQMIERLQREIAARAGR